MNRSSLVSGQSRFASDYTMSGSLHGILITGPSANTMITGIDSIKAAEVPGVFGVISHVNAHNIQTYGSLAPFKFPNYADHYKVFQDNRILFNEQPVALIIAEKMDQARSAVGLLEINYSRDVKQGRGIKKDFKVQSSSKRFERECKGYFATKNYKYPIEELIILAAWSDDKKCKLYCPTTDSKQIQRWLANYLQLCQDDVQVNETNTAGGIHSGAPLYAHYVAVLTAAKELQRPLRVTVM